MASLCSTTLMLRSSSRPTSSTSSFVSIELMFLPVILSLNMKVASRSVTLTPSASDSAFIETGSSTSTSLDGSTDGAILDLRPPGPPGPRAPGPLRNEPGPAGGRRMPPCCIGGRVPLRCCSLASAWRLMLAAPGSDGAERILASRIASCGNSMRPTTVARFCGTSNLRTSSFPVLAGSPGAAGWVVAAAAAGTAAGVLAGVTGLAVTGAATGVAGRVAAGGATGGAGGATIAGAAAAAGATAGAGAGSGSRRGGNSTVGAAAAGAAAAGTAAAGAAAGGSTGAGAGGSGAGAGAAIGGALGAAATGAGALDAGTRSSASSPGSSFLPSVFLTGALGSAFLTNSFLAGTSVAAGALAAGAATAGAVSSPSSAAVAPSSFFLGVAGAATSAAACLR
jgi:hypothetical protein